MYCHVFEVIHSTLPDLLQIRSTIVAADSVQMLVQGGDADAPALGAHGRAEVPAVGAQIIYFNTLDRSCIPTTVDTTTHIQLTWGQGFNILLF